MAKVVEGGVTGPVEGPPQPPEDEGMTEAAISQWEFIGVAPTRDDVLRLLGTLPPVWGVDTLDFADYVQALPQKKKVQRPHPTNPNVQVADSVEAWVLYMSVAGRVKMLERAQTENDWAVDTEPEMLDNGKESGRIVYRETVRIASAYWRPGEGDPLVIVPIGSRTGTAWVPFSGGSNAAGSNPYEKVETSARGRAIGAWGFGVFPGSGIATLEEMQAVAGNRKAIEQEQGPRRGGAVRPTRESLMSQTLTVMEEFRQHRGVDEETMKQEMISYLSGIGVKPAALETGEINWERVHDGQLQLALNKISEHLAAARAQEWGTS